VQELDFLEDDGIFRAEFESKFIPVNGAPYFVLAVFDNAATTDFDFYPSEKAKFSVWALGVLFKGGTQNYYGFEHSVKSEGIYDLEFVIAVTACTVEFDLEVNGGIIAHYKPQSGEVRTEKINISSSLKAGKNSFRIIPQNNGCLIMDYMELRKVQ
jgi:hypothetical protein